MTLPATVPPDLRDGLDAELNFTLTKLTMTPEDKGAGKLRRFTGMAMPWGETTQDYRKLAFNKGSVSWDEGNPTRVKLIDTHDSGRLKSLIGRAAEVWTDDAGLWVTFEVASTAEGDYAWTLLKDGILDGLSIGISWSTYDGLMYDEESGVMTVAGGAVLKEVSLCAIPAMASARVSESFAAQFTSTRTGAPVTESTTLKENTLPEDKSTESAPVTLTGEQLATAIKEGNAELATSLATQIVEGLVAADKAAAALVAAEAPKSNLTVRERPDYGFGDRGTTHIFTRDLARRKYNNDAEASARLQKLEGQLQDGSLDLFAQVRSDVIALSPTQPRQDLYVGQLSYTRPLYDAVSHGNLDEITPFVLPKWVSSSGLVGDHTEGTNPTPGTISLTTQTITPASISGSYKASREAFEAGTPALDQIVRRAMQLSYEEAVEAKIAARLAAVSVSGARAQVVDLSDNAAASLDNGAVIGDKIADILLDQIFIRGGTRIDRTAMSQAPYGYLTKAKDDVGRPLFPRLGVQNADGSKSAGVKALNVHDEIVVPAWALTANTGYSFASESVWTFLSNLRTFTFEEKDGPANIELALFGYQATAVLRDLDVYKLTVQA